MRFYLIVLLILTAFVDTAEADGPLLAIKLNSNNAPVQYCTVPVAVAKDITIDGSFTITGMKISFNEGYKPGEDKLVYSNSVPNITGGWDEARGYYLLKGNSSATKENFRDAIRLVNYENIGSSPTLGIRKISITLEDADYLDETKHFYRYIPNFNIKWSAARIEAASDAMKYLGLLRGYLATITSQGESDFINQKTKAVGWIGATDETVEGDWRWVTGPEGLESTGQGRLFWKGTGALAKSNPAVYGSVKDSNGNDYFQNWNNLNDEPNNAGAENYAHITLFSDPRRVNQSYKWNDLRDNGGEAPDYTPQGYLIEFGDMPGDPVVELSATLDLQVNTVSFYKSGIQPAVCEGTTVELNQPDLNTTPATYVWVPDNTLSATDKANPIATPKFPSSTYTVTGTRGTCPSVTVSYEVPVNPKPVSLLKTEYNICKGEKIALDPGLQKSYKWSTGSTAQTIDVETSDEYNVTLTTEKDCTAPPFTAKVIVHEFPTIDLTNVQKLICGDTKTTLNFIPALATEYSLISADGNAIISNKLDVSVASYGIYPMIYKSAIYSGCPKEVPFNLSFFKNPNGALIVNGRVEGQKCFGYNLNAAFTPEGDLSGANFEWNFGGEVIANGIGIKTLVVPLGVSLIKRDLKLTVTQDGCPASFTEKDILVIPNLSLTVNSGDLACAPLDVVFNATSDGAVRYEWNFGDNILIDGLTPDQKYTYQNAGFYDVHLKVTTGDGCANEVKIPKMVQVNPIPDIAFSLPSDVCLEPGVNEISYAGVIGTARDIYYWDLSQFDPSEIINDPLQTQGPFKFDLKTKPTTTLGLTVESEFGCVSKPIVPFFVKRNPVFSIESGIKEGCIPFETELSGIVPDNDRINFNWNFGDGATGSGSPVSHTYTESGKSYSVTLNGTSSVTGCENVVAATDLLKSYPKPTAKFSMDNKIVYNDKPDVRFTDLSLGASAWLWDFGERSTSTLKNPTYHFMQMGRQKILLEVANADLCTDTVSQILLVAFDRLFPPNGFSPNATNEIDRVFLLNSDGIAPEGYHFKVLSRWSDVVFEAKDEIKGWDGRTESGSFAPAGAYVWILNFTDFIGRKHQQTGTVTLVY